MIVPKGDRTLAIPGSGDVLSGAVAAIQASGSGCAESMCFAAWCHGAAGELLAQQKGRDGVLAREVADALPIVLKGIYDGLFTKS